MLQRMSRPIHITFLNENILNSKQSKNSRILNSTYRNKNKTFLDEINDMKDHYSFNF